MLYRLLNAIGVGGLVMAILTAVELRASSRIPYVDLKDTWPVAVWLICGAAGLGMAGVVKRIDTFNRGSR